MTPAGRATIDEQNPWPGLGAFDEAAERFFNGRSSEIAELRRLVLNAPLTMLFGGSGLGKTSLVQAGLFPALRKERILPVYVRLDVADRQAPLIEQVRQALEEQLGARHVDAPAFCPGEDLWRYLHRSGLELWSAQNQLLTPLFVFDQFEEVFTLGAANQAAIVQFQNDLADLVENRLPVAMAESLQRSESAGAAFSLDRQRYKILISFRSDFLPAVERWKRKLPSIMRSRFQLLPMSGAQAFEAVHATAPQIAGEEIAHKIVEFVAATQQKEIGRTAEAMDETEDVPVEPALLSLVCHGLNEKRKEKGKPEIDQELLDQSASSIIAGYYQGAVHDMPDEVQVFIENELITERGFRKPCDIDDARSLYHVTEAQLETLVKRRLLRIDPQRNTQRVELTHDLLTRVVRDHRDRRRELERQTQRLEREKTLAKARWERRRLAVFMAGGVVLAGAAALFGLMYQHAQRQATMATAGRLAASAVLTKDTTLDLASLLSVEARRFWDTFETRNAELVAFQTNPRLMAYLHHPVSVQSVAISPDGTRLVTAGADSTIQFWDVARRIPLGDPLKGHSAGVNSVAFSPDGKLVASASDDNTIRLWDVATRRPAGDPLKGHTDQVNTVAFSPDGSKLASGSADETVRIWDVRSRALAGQSLETDGVVWSVSFSPDGKLLAAGGDDNTIRFWDPQTHQPAGTTLHADSIVYSVAFGRDSSILASGQGDDSVQLWDVRSGKALGEPMRGHTNYAFGVAFSPDGKTLASASYDQTIRLWDVATRKQIGSSLRGHSSYVYSVTFSPDGKMLISASYDQDVLLWDLSGHDSVGETLRGHVGNIQCVTFSPDGQMLASAAGDETVRFWDVASGKEIGEPVRGPVSFDYIRFSPDGLMFATTGATGVQIWMTASRRRIANLPSKSAVTSVAWNSDGLIAWSCTDGEIDEYDTTKARAVAPPFKAGSRMASQVVYSPDGKLLAVASADKIVRLFSAPAGRLLADLKGHEGPVSSVAFSPDGRLLASSSYDQTVRLWNVAARTELGKPMRGHAAPVMSVAFSPDGKLLASAADDHTVRLWDVGAQLPFGEGFQGHTGAVRTVAFSPDGKWLASGANDQTVRLWGVTLEAWGARSCRLANRNLSMAEWRQYVGAGTRYHLTCPELPAGEGAPR
jgi:WD40 repeat protein